MDFFETISQVFHDLEIYHDSYTKHHECRTGKLMSILGNALNLDNTFCNELEQAGSIHDIGKLTIPDKILEKPGPLSAFEHEVIKLHAEIGHKLIKKINHPLTELASIITLTHHEAYDGSGYPHGLQGEHIPLVGRICSICDVYDALRSNRPYRKPQTHESITRMMSDTGPTGLARKFDPALLEAFLSISDQIIPLYATDLVLPLREDDHK